MDRLAELRALARESFEAADRLVWDETGHNREKSRLYEQADAAC